MKVLIHALGAAMGGAQRHLTQFLPALLRAGGGHQFEVLVRDSFPTVLLGPSVKLRRVADQRAGAWAPRLWGDLVALPRALSREGFQAVVTLTNFGPVWSPVPNMLFQRNPIYYCPYYLERATPAQKSEAMFRRALAVEAMRRAAVVVTPTQAMADMIREACPSTRSYRFEVLPHGFELAHYQAELAPALSERLGQSRGLRLLYPTHPAPHKGFDYLFLAMKILKDSGKHEFTLFTTIERLDWPTEVAKYEKQIENLGIAAQVCFLGRVSQGHMGALYRACDLMVYPSLCESFGFSMIEAMGLGLPIVAADTPVNREMCQGGAAYYSAKDHQALAQAIETALSPDRVNQMREAGMARATGFDWGWDRYARDFLSIMGSLC